MNCNLCARRCNVDRNNTFGFCGLPNKIKIAKVMLYMNEEPCISGSNGSGSIFFSGCNMKCIFCQNYEISSGNVGKEVSISEFSDICIPLKEKIEDIGGLENLKAWLKRKSIIIKNIKNAESFGVDMPKGVLIAGVPGCGKSLCAKAAASLFEVPILRLDVGKKEEYYKLTDSFCNFYLRFVENKKELSNDFWLSTAISRIGSKRSSI